jgi:UDP-GlcNAc:undecaprenyl-phosphate GlcNAc-1-phosphate transferase
MNINYLYIILLIFNFSFVFFFERISKFINIFDYPDKKRKIHLKKTACIGGLLIFFNLLIFFAIYNFSNNFLLFNHLFLTNKEIFIFLVFSIFFLIFGIIDDKYALNANYKFILFFCGIYLLIHFDKSLLIKNLNFSFTNNPLNIENISVFFTILSFLLFINAFNMFDGINLQSSFYSLFIFVIFYLKGVYPELCIILLISLLFFSYLNYNGKCFLGNSGSLLIAYIISVISIKSANSLKVIKGDEIFLMMLIPGIDLLRLAFIRILENKHPFSADRNHIHHILINNFNLNKTLSILMALIIIPNIISFYFGHTVELILISLFIYFFIIYNFKIPSR